MQQHQVGRPVCNSLASIMQGCFHTYRHGMIVPGCTIDTQRTVLKHAETQSLHPNGCTSQLPHPEGCAHTLVHAARVLGTLFDSVNPRGPKQSWNWGTCRPRHSVLPPADVWPHLAVPPSLPHSVACLACFAAGAQGEILSFVKSARDAGKKVLIHCWGGEQQ
jgi:hypothetical protein